MKIPLIFPKFVQGIGSMQQKQIGIKLLFLFKANKSTPNKPVHETNRQLQLETFSWQLKQRQAQIPMSFDNAQQGKKI